MYIIMQWNLIKLFFIYLLTRVKNKLNPENQVNNPLKTELFSHEIALF